MPELPDGFQQPTRDELIQRYKRDVKLRVPAADVGPGTQPDIDARFVTDIALPIFANAGIIARGISEEDADTKALDALGERLGIPRQKASGASGYVSTPTSASGAEVIEGMRLKAVQDQSNLRYEAAQSRHIGPGDNLVAVRGVDTGPGTDKPVDTVLQWESPSPGMADFATVVEDADGDGLTGGTAVESNESYYTRIQGQRENPPNNAGNDADVQERVENTPNLQVEKCFTYPAVLGGGSSAFTFTLKPASLGGDRKPNAVQLAAAEAWLRTGMPGDDSFYELAIQGEELDVVLKVKWDRSARGWVDRSPWPPYHATGATQGQVVVLGGLQATEFVAGIFNGQPSSPAVRAPVAGQVVALWDNATYTWRRKAIKTVTPLSDVSWNLVIETAENASDPNYVPKLNQRISPWSDSLQTLVNPILRLFAKLGPGELYLNELGDGRRRLRNPENPSGWPAAMTAQLESDLLKLAAVQNVDFVEGNGTEPGLVSPSIVGLLELSDLAVFPK